jgi:hypothetical protein|tara:strand:- start:2449 stop:2814 length:366 start_codon:yes stop_codon:yes gene_type:complete
MKIYPRCHPYWFIDGEKVKNHEYKPYGHRLAYTSEDYILPCCWCDTPNNNDDMARHGLYNESLKVENNDKIVDIIGSDVWALFQDTLLNTPEIAPIVCQRKCGSDPKSDNLQAVKWVKNDA